MFGVNGNKHRYFRIQVMVFVVMSLIVFSATHGGDVDAALNNSMLAQFNISLFTWGVIGAAVVLSYFIYGEVHIYRSIFFALILFAITFYFPAFGFNWSDGSASADRVLSGY